MIKKQGRPFGKKPDARVEVISVAVSDTCKKRVLNYQTKHELGTLSLAALQLILIGLAVANQDKDLRNGNL